MPLNCEPREVEYTHEGVGFITFVAETIAFVLNGHQITCSCSGRVVEEERVQMRCCAR